MRRAKVVCTIGPSSNTPERIEALIRAGMNVARLNFSHGTHEEHARVIHHIRAIAERLREPIAILQDLQGPKIRVGRFQHGEVQLTEGQMFSFVTADVLGDETRVSTTYPELARDVCEGEEILLDDDLLRVRVERIHDEMVDVRVLVGGTLRNNKGMNLPSTRVSIPALTAKDREDLEFGLAHNVDYVALSFVRSGLDIHQLRCYLPEDRYLCPGVIAKIEKPQAVQNLHEIVAAADGIMVARGDLGVELPAEQVPIIQKRAIELANSMGKLSITATQMLESMTVNPLPTRAEASDVANAIFDGTDAVMLSGETAAGRYPIESVEMMCRIVAEAESSAFFRFDRARVRGADGLQSFAVAISRAAGAAADDLNVAAIVCFTVGGGTARLIKSQRSNRQVVAFTPIEQTWRKMALYRGIRPVHTEVRYETDALISMVEDRLCEEGLARPGDQLIIVMGVPVGVGTPTNTIKFHAIPFDRPLPPSR
jgi:pyruvate kinase